jgi:uncharacterized membrane protein YdfJ with MMPL/SSD domain
MWVRVGWAIAPRPRRVWVTAAVVLGVLALGLTGLKASGLTAAQGFRGHPDSVTGQPVLAEHSPRARAHRSSWSATRMRRPLCGPPSPPPGGSLQ